MGTGDIAYSRPGENIFMFEYYLTMLDTVHRGTISEDSNSGQIFVEASTSASRDGRVKTGDCSFSINTDKWCLITSGATCEAYACP